VALRQLPAAVNSSRFYAESICPTCRSQLL